MTDMTKYGARRRAGKVWLRFLVYGPNFSQKTGFILSCPNPFLIDIERGSDKYHLTEAFDGAPMDFLESPTDSAYDAIKIIHDMYVDGVLADPGDDFSTIAVDSMSVLYEMLNSEYAEQTGRVDKLLTSEERMFDRDQLRFDEWAKLKNPLRKMMTWLDKAQCHKVFTAHANSVFTEELDGRGKKTMTVTGQSAKGSNETLYKVDIILEMLSLDNDLNKNGLPSTCRVEKDRTNSYRKNDIIENVSFANWMPFIELGKLLPEDEPVTTFMAPEENISEFEAAVQMCKENAMVQKYATILGLTEMQLDAGIRTPERNADLNLVLIALKEKIKERGL